MNRLTRISVLDLAGELGAYCTKLLADEGAEVTVVEPPTGGPLRAFAPKLTTQSDEEVSAFHLFYNANKQSVTLDPADPGFSASLEGLIDKADVVVAGETPDLACPDLDADGWTSRGGIWCVVRPFASGGPYRDFVSTHLTSHAMAGHMFSQGPQEGPPISIPGLSAFDETGQHAAMCIVAALRRRHDVGGQIIQLAVQEILGAQLYTIQRFSHAGVMGGRGGMQLTPPSGTWDCKDGQVEFQVWVPGHWDEFVHLLGDPPELQNPEWRDRTVRARDADLIRPTVKAEILKRSAKDLYRAAQAVGIPSSPVSTLSSFAEDEQIVFREFIGEAVDPEVGSYRVPGRGYRIDGEPRWSKSGTETSK